MKQGGFKLRSWASNNKHLCEKTRQNGLHETDTTVRVLGLKWDTITDDLLYSSPQQHNSNVYTKREIIRATSSLYDPLGALSPVHIKAKNFIQRLWQSKLGWDDNLPPEMIQEWHEIQQDLDCSRYIVIKRSYFTNETTDPDDYELHVFADASSKAYGAVIYLVHNEESAFVMSKTRVKPLKEITLPRLELLASFVAARLTRFVCEALHRLDLRKIVLWSDSQIVLHWIHSHKKLPTFVENRVKLIRETPFTDIKYCRTGDNPADLLTRGISCENLDNSKLWWNGPEWLITGDWPICDVIDSKILTCQSDEIDENELKVDDKGNVSTRKTLADIIDIKRYSSLGRLLRVTAYVMRFINKLKKQNHVESENFITVSELKQAENMWIKTIQSDVYSSELMEIEQKCKKRCSLVHQLNLFKDTDNFIRCKGRLENASINYDTKYPILLPRQHYFTELMIKRAHLLLLHAGVSSTVTFIRRKFWIPKIRQVVKCVIRSCVPCVKVIGRSFRQPETPPLPKCRIQESDPFSITGVDFTGALFYKTDTSKLNKAYICLFTCAII